MRFGDFLKPISYVIMTWAATMPRCQPHAPPRPDAGRRSLFRLIHGNPHAEIEDERELTASVPSRSRALVCEGISRAQRNFYGAILLGDEGQCCTLP